MTISYRIELIHVDKHPQIPFSVLQLSQPLASVKEKLDESSPVLQNCRICRVHRVEVRTKGVQHDDLDQLNLRVAIK